MVSIDQYIGGVEHAVLHLIYCRFFTKVMRDMGLIAWDEPVRRLFTQGMVIRDGRKMSKNLGNIVSPENLVEKYGSDTARMFALFAAPPDRDLDWQDEGVEGMWRFLSRVFRFVMRNADPNVEPGAQARGAADRAVLRKLHRTIAKVTADFESRWHFNTSIAAIMELTNELYAAGSGLSAPVKQQAVRDLTLLLSPFAPHMAEEMWRAAGGTRSVWTPHGRKPTRPGERRQRPGGRPGQRQAPRPHRSSEDARQRRTRRAGEAKRQDSFFTGRQNPGEDHRGYRTNWSISLSARIAGAAGAGLPRSV